MDFASWNGLNASAFATLLGATEKGVLGIKQGGNKAGDLLRVHGSATFVDEGGSWAAVPWVAPAVGEGSPENNTGPPSEAKRLLDAVQALLTGGGGDRALRSAIVAEELAKAYGWMQLRVDRLDQAFVLAGGQAGGEYAGVAAIIAGTLGGHGLEARAVTTGGSIENARLVSQKLADVGLIQNDVAAQAAKGAGPFAEDGAMAELRALGSLFPEPIQIVTAKDSPIATDRRPEGQARRARAGGLRHARQRRGAVGRERRGAGRSRLDPGGGPGRGAAAARGRRGRRGDHDAGRPGARAPGGGGDDRHQAAVAGHAGAGDPDRRPSRAGAGDPAAQHLSRPDARAWKRWR